MTVGNLTPRRVRPCLWLGLLDDLLQLVRQEESKLEQPSRLA
ncbi:MAG: hypothetical protein ACK46L_13405 [Synechococcaceae cyanobacterium]|jgi:hypothetical protein